MVEIWKIFVKQCRNFVKICRELQKKCKKLQEMASESALYGIMKGQKAEILKKYWFLKHFGREAGVGQAWMALFSGCGLAEGAGPLKLYIYILNRNGGWTSLDGLVFGAWSGGGRGAT